MQVKNITTLRGGDFSPLFSWTPAKLYHIDSSGRGLADLEGRVFHFPCPPRNYPDLKVQNFLLLCNLRAVQLILSKVPSDQVLC